MAYRIEKNINKNRFFENLKEIGLTQCKIIENLSKQLKEKDISIDSNIKDFRKILNDLKNDINNIYSTKTKRRKSCDT